MLGFTEIVRRFPGNFPKSRNPMNPGEANFWRFWRSQGTRRPSITEFRRNWNTAFLAHLNSGNVEADRVRVPGLKIPVQAV